MRATRVCPNAQASNLAVYADREAVTRCCRNQSVPRCCCGSSYGLMIAVKGGSGGSAPKSICRCSSDSCSSTASVLAGQCALRVDMMCLSPWSTSTAAARLPPPWECTRSMFVSVAARLWAPRRQSVASMSGMRLDGGPPAQLSLRHQSSRALRSARMHARTESLHGMAILG